MYAIYIANPANFSASTVNGATFDTQLWLFDADGKGVVFNDNAVGTTGSQSRIDNSSGCLTNRPPGVYYLAISRHDRDATGCEGGLIWLSTPFRAVRCPDGAERASRVAGWLGSTAAGMTTPFSLQAQRAPQQATLPTVRRSTVGMRPTTATTRATYQQQRNGLRCLTRRPANHP